MSNFVAAEIIATIDVMQQFLDDLMGLETVSEMGAVCGARLVAGSKIMIAGNGGSAADSQHIAAEFIGRFTVDRCPLAAIALTADSSILTASGNDYGFDTVFERQIQALGRKGDILLGISTSGDSPNVLRALAAAREMGLITMGLTGSAGSNLASLCDYVIRVPSNCTRHIQEMHIVIAHIICGVAEKAFLPALAVHSTGRSV
jgi:D-sedoheptulose 7-phosphate isomerase